MASTHSFEEDLSTKTTLVQVNNEFSQLHTVDSFISYSDRSLNTDIEDELPIEYKNNYRPNKADANFSKEVTRENNSSDFEGDDDDDDYPEGGLRAWIVTFGCFLGLVACFGLLNTTGVIENFLQYHQLADENTSTIGWVFSLMLFICFASCIFSGTYFDRNGFRDPMILGTVLHVGGLFATANSTKLWHFILSFSVVVGFGNGILLSPLVSAPAHYFKKRRGTASALATVGGSVGGGLFPLMLRKFFSMTKENDPYYGYVWGIRTLAFINLALLILSLCLAKERLPHVGDDINVGESRLRHILRIYIIESFDAAAFKDLRYVFCVIGTCIGELSLCSVITYYAADAMNKGITQNDSYMLIMVINLTGIPGRWVPGRLSDSFGRFNVAIGTLVCLGIVMFVAWLPFGNNLTNMYVISALYGFFSGSIFSLLPVCCGQISKTEEFGRRYSTMYFCVSVFTLVGVPITGAIIGKGSNAEYQHYKIFCGVTTLFSAACFVISRYFAVGMRWKKF